MIIDSKIRMYGIDEAMINEIHSKTKISHCKIKEAEYQTLFDNKNRYTDDHNWVLTIKLHLEYRERTRDRRFASMDIPLKKLIKLKTK